MTKVINFQEHQPKRGRGISRTPPMASVTTDIGRLFMSKGTIQKLEMGGKYVKFYSDPAQKIIGWKVEAVIPPDQLHEWRLCEPHRNGVWMVSIKRLLEEMGWEELKPEYKRLPVQSYRDVGTMAVPKGLYYFVELKD